MYNSINHNYVSFVRGSDPFQDRDNKFSLNLDMSEDYNYTPAIISPNGIKSPIKNL